MNHFHVLLAGLLPFLGCATAVGAASPIDNSFTTPARGFVSEQPAKNWDQGILTGNGTMGAVVLGDPYNETLFLSHSSLYLPQTVNPKFIDLASHLGKIRELALAGNYGGAAGQINAARAETGYTDQRDPFIGAAALHITQPPSTVTHYQRSVDFMTAETRVTVADGNGTFTRSAFVSRPDGVIVVKLAGSGKQSAEFSLAALPPADDKQKAMIAAGVKSTDQGVKDGDLYFRTLFAVQNQFNPNRGYEVVGTVVNQGGTRVETPSSIQIAGADEILLLIKIRPLLKTDTDSNTPAIEAELNQLPADYETLLARQARVQGDLMGRVSLSLDAPVDDRTKSVEALNKDSSTMDAPLAKIERAFDAGRYNIICSSGPNPPNLQGLWSGTWSAPWSGSFTTNGNLPCAVSFLLMGNTPELMDGYFRYYDDRLPGFRQNAKALFGMRGFQVPAQLTLSPLETDFGPAYPHNFWYGGAAWACEYYYDYYRYTGDKKFLASRAYPLMKEAAAFYEDFLTVTDKDGKLVVVPSYSPENAPSNTHVATAINATMEISAAKQLLSHCIEAAQLLGADPELQTKWADIIHRLPDYQVGPDGSFREWLWPGLDEANQHRHASNLYALYDEMPAEIVNHPDLVDAVAHSVRERLSFQESHPVMAFGIVQEGLASTHTGHADLAQEAINFLAKGYWSTGMASFHNRGGLFNMDISGGFPYLCASTLVYSEPGHIVFFPARPAQWSSGSLKGVRLRGGAVVRELTWDPQKTKAVLVADSDQTVTLTWPGGGPKTVSLKAGKPAEIDF